MKLIVTIAAGFFLMVAPQGNRDFSGMWNLDVKKSVNLPPSFAQVESYTMNIRQTPDSMIVVIGLVGSGQSVTFPVTNYLFSGKEVFRDDTLRHSKRWTTCEWAPGGKSLIVASRVEQGTGEKKKEYNERDEWQMTDSTTFQMTVTQKFVRGDSTRNELRVFHRSK
jgi:hypothetical protein